MIDLTTQYLGLTLKNPIVVSASPLSEDLGNIRRMEDSGAAAIVLPSLFEEQIHVESNTLDHFALAGNRQLCGVAYLYAQPRRLQTRPRRLS